MTQIYLAPTLQDISALVPHMSDQKQKELKKVVQIIYECSWDKRSDPLPRVEMIILFGSYARGDYVESDVTVHEGHTLEYRSDFDILVITKKPVYELNRRLDSEITKRIHNDKSILSPVWLIIEDIWHINARLHEHRYFYMDIKREWITLYTTGHIELVDPGPLDPALRLKLQKEDFATWFQKGEDLFWHSELCLKKSTRNLWAFLLHQSTESYISAYLLVVNGYKPKTHDMRVLYAVLKDSNKEIFWPRFDLKEPDDKKLFHLLYKAYVDARYSKLYSITENELTILFKRTTRLKNQIQQLCEPIIGQRTPETDQH